MTANSAMSVLAAAVVTSRRGRLVARDDPWLSGLRAALRSIRSTELRLVVGDHTAGADLVCHAASRLSIPHSIVSMPGNRGTNRDQIGTRLHPERESVAISAADKVPVVDRALFAAADVVYVLQLRSGGNLHQLLLERLRQRQGRSILVDLPNLQPDTLKAELCLAGAELWKPELELCCPFEGQLPATMRSAAGSNVNDTVSRIDDSVYLVVPFPQADRWEFLTHSTRSRPGPWPGESFEQHADSLLESRPDADHSALGALCRIVAQKRLIASGETIRGGQRAVSLTACPLAQLPDLHRFRPHRVRWDFEPYGLCLRREWLMKRGARPVNYGDETVWQSLQEVDRPYFQLATGKSGIDWTIEQEWRVCGDLDLAELTADDILLFVPDFESAKSLAELTDWPITLWPG